MTVQTKTPPTGRELIDAGRDALSAVQHEFDRIYTDFSRGLDRLGIGAIAPRIDFSETGDQVEITAELPGLEEKDIEVSVAGDVLTISGEKKVETERKDRNYWFAERSYGSILRRIALPEGVDPNSVKASMAKGVLKVTMKKPTGRTTAKKIEVKAATA